ncbi:MAG TPA: hypothetical protein VNM90_18060 [Haliangium sp.]|nr:hypothetical protein [Haliangium sp.]
MRLLLGLLAGAWVRMHARQTVAIEGAPRDQVITVRGVAVARDLLESPLSGTPCVYYRYSVEEWRRSRLLGAGSDGGFWQLAEHDEAIAEFYVDDGTARAIVAPGDARVRPARRLAGAPMEIVDPVGGASIELGMNRRAHELLIEPGDLLTITGHAVEVADLFDDSRDYRATPQRLMLRAPESSPLDIRILRKRPPGA